MKDRLSSHLFWGSHSPLAALTGAGLIVMASARLSFAILCAAALVWVYVLTALAFSGARKIMPIRGKSVILLFLSAFFSGLFMLLAGLLNPLLILGAGFFLVLVPPCCLASGFHEASKLSPLSEVFLRSLFEAGALAAVILAVSLIREPLGMGTLSVPWGVHGVTEVFDVYNELNFLPIRLFSVSTGGLLLLGYSLALFRYLRERGGNIPRGEEPEDGQ